MKKVHGHPSTPQVECEKCGGSVKMTSASYPQSYECVCRECKHRFRWINAKADSYD